MLSIVYLELHFFIWNMFPNRLFRNRNVAQYNPPGVETEIFKEN